MDAHYKKLWIDALRSGKYKQGTGFLRKESDSGEEQYCCLGVLCDIVDPSKWLDNGVTGLKYYHHNGALISLPGAVAQKVGISDGPVEFIDKHGFVRSLACENDRGRPFQEIAQIIEEHF